MLGFIYEPRVQLEIYMRS